jgi:hypothetical protein
MRKNGVVFPLSATRFALGVLVAPLFALCALPVEAQQLAKTPRVGFLSTLSAPAMKDRLEAFRHGLRDLGYTEGQNILLEYRYSDGNVERLSDLAAELASLRVDVLISGGGNVSTVALKKATASIPIVMTVGSDPVIAGLVSSLARPGGNVTGLSQMNPELIGKQLELLKEVAPQVTRVAVVTGRRDRPTLAGTECLEGLGGFLGRLRSKRLPLGDLGLADAGRLRLGARHALRHPSGDQAVVDLLIHLHLFSHSQPPNGRPLRFGRPCSPLC